MIVPQIKLFNLCIKLGHKAYFPFPSPPFTAPIHVSALCYREEELCWRAELCGWLFSISMMRFTSTACSQLLRRHAESKQSVFYHDALWVHCHYAANAISIVVLVFFFFFCNNPLPICVTSITKSVICQVFLSPLSHAGSCQIWVCKLTKSLLLLVCKVSITICSSHRGFVFFSSRCGSKKKKKGVFLKLVIK